MAVLKPFEATTKEISADKHVSISKVIPLAKSLQRLTGAITEKDTPLVSNPSYKMRRRFTNIESARMLAMSTLLDPRMKKLAFSDSFSGSRETGRAVGCSGDVRACPD